MKSLKHLNKYLYKYRLRFLLGIMFVIVSNIFAIYPAKIIRDAIDTVKIALTTSGDLQDVEKSLFYFGALVIALALLKGLFMFFMRQTLIVMSRLIEYDLKNEVYAHYQQLTMSFYKTNNTGDLMNRISEDVSRVRMYLGPSIMYTLNLIVLFILVIITMFSVNVTLTLYVLVPLPLLSLTIYWVSSIINRKSEAVQQQLSRLSTYVQEAFSGIRVIKSFAKEESFAGEFEKQCDSYKRRSLDLVKTNALFHPFMILLIGLSTLLTVYIGGIETIRGNVTIGNIAEFVIYVNMLTWPVASVGWVTSLVQRAAASQERINEFLMQKPEITLGLAETNDGNSEIKGDIEFRNVTFVYPDSGIYALKNISFKIKEGSTLAILGKTASGKTTIAHLLARLYDVTKGEILIDGVSIRNIDLSHLRSSIGYVPQDVFLFSDTISNNVGFGKIDGISREEDINTALTKAAIYENIESFPGGINTMIGERGVTLSGGQKQRVSIARAIVRNPRILIFDDCLSAVDTHTEEQILNNLKPVMEGKTTLIIGHRVSSMRNADRIIVIERGAVVETGTHEELMEKTGAYYDIYNRQLMEERQKDLII